MITQSYSDTILKDNFQNPEKWLFLSDQVMGGVSSGKVFFNSKNDKNYAYLSGKVSTQNNGGFIQIRRKLNNINLSKSQYIKDFKRSGSFLSKIINPKSITSIGLVAFGRDHLAELYIQEIEFIE